MIARAKAWREAVETAVSCTGRYWVQRKEKESGNFVEQWQNARTMGEGISALEKEFGCKARIVLARSERLGLRRIFCELHGVGLAENEGWETNG